ncbi:MAG: hypothetical protein PV345_05890 [Wolbachia sp.]|nr:hypothetical protein [Wolbachia sp.]
MGYTRQISSIEGSTNIQKQEDNDVHHRRIASCEEQIMRKKKSNEKPSKTLQSPDFNENNSVSYSGSK